MIELLNLLASVIIPTMLSSEYAYTNMSHCWSRNSFLKISMNRSKPSSLLGMDLWQMLARRSNCVYLNSQKFPSNLTEVEHLNWNIISKPEVSSIGLRVCFICQTPTHTYLPVVMNDTQICSMKRHDQIYLSDQIYEEEEDATVGLNVAYSAILSDIRHNSLCLSWYDALVGLLGHLCTKDTGYTLAFNRRRIFFPTKTLKYKLDSLIAGNLLIAMMLILLVPCIWKSLWTLVSQVHFLNTPCLFSQSLIEVNIPTRKLFMGRESSSTLVPNSSSYLEQCKIRSHQNNPDTKTPPLYKKQSNSFWDNLGNAKSIGYDGIFSRYFRVKTTATVWPTSIAQYLSDKLETTAQDGALMNHEWARFATFKDFPERSPAYPHRLAKAGLYHTGTQDEVRCFSCKQLRHGWKRGEIPWNVHKEISPSCDFVCNRDMSNIPISDHHDNTSSRYVAGQKEIGATGGPRDASAESNGHVKNKEVHTEATQPREKRNASSALAAARSTSRQEPQRQQTVKHPDFVSVNARLSSFSGWPSTASHQPRDLCIAGFYYAGFSDCVRCFHCGGGLRNWEYGDCPWVEHARWYPNCEYVKQVKGHAFIQETQEELERLQGNESTPPAATENGQAGRLLDTAAAKSILDMGFNRETVRSAIDSFRTAYGHINFTVTDLLDMITETEQIRTAELPLPQTAETEVHSNANRQRPTKKHAQSQKHNAGMACGSGSPVSATVGMTRKNGGDSQVSGLCSAAESTATMSVASLKADNRRMKEEMMCKVCRKNDADTLYLPCGHVAVCSTCASGLTHCIVCQTKIKGSVKTYIM